MPGRLPNCPHCEKSDQVIKVNQIYIESISAKPVSDERVIPRVLNWPEDKSFTNFRSPGERGFLNLFKPPSGKPSMLKSIHPDQVVIGFTLISLFVLYRTYTAQPEAFFPAIGVLALFFIVYGLGRKWIVARYQKQKDQEAAQVKGYAAAIGKWMKLYYCIRDQGVFDPAKGVLIPIEEMNNYLMDDPKLKER